MPESVDDKQRLSGSRGEFVASLGRRLQTLRAALKSLEQDPGDVSRRNALLRRAHALGAAARVLGFASVAEALAGAERVIAKSRQGVSAAELAEVSRVLDVLPSLVGGAPLSMPPQAIATNPEELSGRHWPLSLLLFGGEQLEEKLTRAVKRDNVEFERAVDVERAAQIARVLGPDLVLVDADAPRATEFFERMQRDDLTEPVSSIFVGDFKDPGEPQRLTVLGATRVLKEPVSPDTLRRTIEELCQSPLSAGDTEKPFGQLTVKGLAERLAEEIERGLVQATQAGTQATRVDFGDGTDVMAAVWGTVTRVRELVTARSQGAVRFDPIGPEGAIALAPWGDRERRAGERGARSGRDESQVSLSGRSVVVVDDDPAVTWFLSGLLKTVGAEVLEAYDGVEALDLAYTRWPDLIVSDVLMPKLDGFSLCREIKRDVAVRDTPVILLSWKEDLLQRMRELGADADGYLRKEAAASTVVQRIREVMRPRARVEARLRQGGEVRGRLDGLTPRLVIELCCKSKQDLRLEFRDAFFNYVLQVRRGRLVAAERVGAAGAQARAETAVRSLLGVSAGRFLVVPDRSQIQPEFEGELPSVLGSFIDQARSWQRAFATLPLASIESVAFEPEELEVYSKVAPVLVRDLLVKLDAGVGPKALLLEGSTAPDVLLHTLLDLARRGVVSQVVGAEGPWSHSSGALARSGVGAAGEASPGGGAGSSDPPMPAVAEGGLEVARDPIPGDTPEVPGRESDGGVQAGGVQAGEVQAGEVQAGEVQSRDDRHSEAAQDPAVPSSPAAEAPVSEQASATPGPSAADDPTLAGGAMATAQDVPAATADGVSEAVPAAGNAMVSVSVSSPRAAAAGVTARRRGTPGPGQASSPGSESSEKLAPSHMLPVAEGSMDSLDPKSVTTEGGSTAAFSFQLSPEPPRAEVPPGRKRSHLPAARPVTADEELDDAGWFGSTLDAVPPLALGASGALSEAETRTPPPAQVQSTDEAHEPADPLAKTAVSTAHPLVIGEAAPEPPSAPQQYTPASGQQIAAFLSDESEPPPPALHGGTAQPLGARAEPGSADAPLPATKSIEFPPRSARSAVPVGGAVPSAAVSSPPVPAPSADEQVSTQHAAEPEPVLALQTGRREPREPETAPVSAPISSGEQGVETPAAFEQPATSEPGRAVPTPKGMRAAPAPRDTSSTLKVIGYALVAMVFSYLGMSAIVSWFGEPAPEPTATAEGVAAEGLPSSGDPEATGLADEGLEDSAQGVPLGKASPSVAPPGSKTKTEPAKAAKFVVTNMPLPAGLAIGKDKGVLKITTPDAHTIYVDGEFAGRGPIRIVPLPPGKHEVKTRYEGEEHAFSADVKAGRMTRLSLGTDE